MKLDTMRDLYISELKDLYSAEKQLTRALEKLAKASENGKLREGFLAHLEETKAHIERLDRIFEGMGESPGRHKCKGIEGIIEEGDEKVKTSGDAQVKDAALICAAQRAEHYEIAGYGCAATYAAMLGQDEAVRLLEQTLEEEKAADRKLTKIAETMVNPRAAAAAGV